MSYTLSLIPMTLFPYTSSIVPMTGLSIPAVAANSLVTAAGTSAAANSIATAAGTSAAASAMTGTTVSTAGTALAQATTAAAASQAFAAFVTAALPAAVTVIAVFAAGLTLDMIHQDRQMRKNAELEIPTVFSDKDTLIRALFAYDKEQECSIYDDPEHQVVTVKFRLQDYCFQMNNERGCYDLRIKNAGTCKKMLDSVNAIQDEYLKAVKNSVVEQLYNHVKLNGWSVESDTYDEENNRVITIEV